MNLRYCPFCGSDNADFEDAIFGYQVCCDDCGACGSGEETKEKAAGCWNQRVNEETLEE